MKNIIKEKSFAFAVDIVNTCRNIQTEQKEFIITKQVIRSGSAIGALVREAEHAESKKDFIHKFSIAQKETNETLYWLELLEATQHLSNSLFIELHYKATELLKLITSILKTSKTKLNN
ncbi:four helix bundle protein [Carboxylicivirga linearis]|uniref:Four helix bundle protein n=1 Tax=Carboxylicivirga linearis TaxID=1628157 RepID=A0ABS5JUR6_9BACT|nr:four helix bundle protein [Carboxylicivirga linearis]MBS2098640.1 four helix bundle protein [Carboxylicivirga linearis]